MFNTSLCTLYCNTHVRPYTPNTPCWQFMLISVEDLQIGRIANLVSSIRSRRSCFNWTTKKMPSKQQTQKIANRTTVVHSTKMFLYLPLWLSPFVLVHPFCLKSICKFSYFSYQDFFICTQIYFSSKSTLKKILHCAVWKMMIMK